VLLRELTDGDAEAFVRLARGSRELHRGWVAPPTSKARYATYLARVGADFRALVACRREDGALVGVFNLSQISYGNFCSAYLGYFAFEPFAGQGYMTEALGLVLRFAFRALGLHRVEANIQPENTPSIRLAKRCGFELEGYSPRYLKVGGRWRDHERWAIRAETWRPAAQRARSPGRPPGARRA